MGKKSTKENKNIYQLSREEMELTREKASDQMLTVSADRIEKIESNKSAPHPDEILLMAECYKKPILCNYYCSHECPIGEKLVPEIRSAELPQIILQMLSLLNSLYEDKNRLIEIAADGEISEEEIPDFVKIQGKLDSISRAADSLQLWIQNAIVSGRIDKEALAAASSDR